MTQTIEFTDIHDWDPDRQCLSMEVLVDGTRARCLLSWDMLRSHFGANDTEAVSEIFEENRMTIKDIAEVMIEERGLDENGEILIRGEDIG